MHALTCQGTKCLVLPSMDPLFAVTALSGVSSAFKSYPTMGDTSLFLGLVALHVDLLLCE